MAQYYIVTQSVVDAWNGTIKGDIGISFRQDNSGNWVINVEVVSDWPEINWQGMEVIELGINDFSNNTGIV